MAGVPKISKLDGREVAFDPRKVADAMHAALGEEGEPDRMLADELAAVVALFLTRDFAGRTASVDDVQDMVETVLIETGHARAAKAYILDRRKRVELERELQVRSGHGVTDLSVGVTSPIRQSAWNKQKIVAALVTEADLPAPLAEEIADAVEMRVARSGLRRISVSLIRELVDNELFERGLSAPLARQKTIGLPRYDLDRWIHAHDAVPSLELLAGRALLQRHALEALLPIALAEPHLEGRLHLDLLGAPHRLLDLAVNVASEGARRASDPVAHADLLALAVRECMRFAERSVCVFGLEPVLERLTEARDVARLVRGFVGVGEGTIVLALLAEPSQQDAFLRALRAIAVELRRLGECPTTPRVRVAASAALLQDHDLCEALVQLGSVELMRPGAAPSVLMLPLVQRVGINLERATLVAAGSFARARDELAVVLELAAQACEARWRSIRERLPRAASPLVSIDHAAAPRAAIAPLRLGAAIEALRHGSSTSAVTRDLLNFLAERFAALGVAHGFRGELDVMPFVAAERRVASIEADLRPQLAMAEPPPSPAPSFVADLAAFDPWRRLAMTDAMDLTERLALLREDALVEAGRHAS